MPKKNRRTFLLRKMLIGAIIAFFTYLSIIFIYQYREYQKVEDRLNTAYEAGKNQSSALYRLFSTFSEADNLFRLYTIDFNKLTYANYKGKLDTIKYYVDSLSTLPLTNNPLNGSSTDINEKDKYASEFVSLKKSVDNLIFLADDSLSKLTTTNQHVVKSKTVGADSVISRILTDTAFNRIQADTVVQKKQGLFKRIFKAKSDTSVAKETTRQLNVNQIDILQRNIENVIVQNERVFNSNLSNLQQKFATLRQKERELVQANYRLLNNMKAGIDNLKEQEQLSIKKAEQRDLALYKENTKQFGNQLIAALSIMLLMIFFILFYQYNAASYERKLQDEKEYAAKVAEEKTSVLANVSHEVRTPINSLLGIIDILKKNGDTKVINTEYLDSAAHEIAVINSSVSDILNLSKLEVGALNVKYEYFSPKSVLMDIIGLHNYQARKKGLTLNHEIDIDQKLEIYSSIFRIKQIVSNLVSNAIKYTPSGSILLSASIKDINGKDTLVVEVKDTGLGIAPEHQNNIFRQYYMTDNKSKVGGFGLGLYISKLLAEQLQGDITLISTLGKGSTFKLTVPFTEQRLEKKEQKHYTLADLPKDLRLVLIDDNRINTLYLKHYFKDFPQVSTFEDGRAALEYIQQNSVDVVITDLMMPEVDGWAILKSIRENPTLQKTSVFVFTADSMNLEETENKGTDYSFDAVLSKPLDENEIVSKILKAL